MCIDRATNTWQFRIRMVCLFLAGVMLLSACRVKEIVINDTPVPPLPSLDEKKITAGKELYAMHCAGCHGVNLEGSPNWKQPRPDGTFPPPPQDSSGHTWHHADQQLVQIIQKGGDPAFGGTMPGFLDKLSEEEILSIVEYFKSSWGQEEREFQWWMTATTPK